MLWSVCGPMRRFSRHERGKKRGPPTGTKEARMQTIIRLVASILATMILASGVQAQAPDFTVITLGTGSPPPILERFGPATLVRAGDQTLLIDPGRGAGQRVWQAKVRIGSLSGVFLTHLHSDHTVGLPDLWLIGWLPSPY